MVKIVVGVNDLATTNPELLEEWDYDKNIGISPESIHVGTAKKVWWLCSTCGRSWQAEVRNRSKHGNGCAVCSGKACGKGVNDLATVYPEIAEEFDSAKNGFGACDIAAHTQKKVWWRCKTCGKSWLSSVANRTGVNLNGCPHCRKEKRTSFPEQAIFYYVKKFFYCAVNSYRLQDQKELDIYIPTMKIGIEYDGVIWHTNIEKDESKNNICIQKGITLIRIREKGLPELLTDCTVYEVEPNNMCDLDNVVKLLLTNDLHIPSDKVDVNIQRDIFDIQAQFRSKKQADSVLVQFPEIAEEWNEEKNRDLTPDRLTTGSGVKVWWKCKECGYEWRTAIYCRTQGNTGCPKCGYKRGHEKYMAQKLVENTLQETLPHLVQEWNTDKNGDLTPDKVTPKSHMKVWWICFTCGNEWQAVISNRAKGIGCPCCSNKQAVKGVNDLATTNPELAEEWDFDKNNDLQPTDVTSGSGKKVWWVCKKYHHSWRAAISDRKKQGCPYCANKKVLKGFNDLATTNPELAEEWDLKKNVDLQPTEITYGSGKIVWWLCKMYHHSYQASIAQRVCNKMDCPICANRQVLKGVNDLATTNSELVREWDFDKNGELKPTDVTSGSGKKVYWKCSVCGYGWKAVIGSRTSGCGCPQCGKQKSALTRRLNLPVGDSLQEKFPDIAKEWDLQRNEEATPETVSCGSDMKAWWICSTCGHDWKSSISSRTRGSGCPECGRAKTAKAKQKSIICTDTGEIFSSIKEASQKYKIEAGNISACCKGKRNKAGGYRWRFADE